MGTDTTTYPNLGFNPVPGVPDDVEAMGSKIGAAVSSMAEADQLISRLRDSSSGVWVGSAGDAFRAHFDGTLSKDIQNAHTSLTTAVSVLRGWHGDLVGFKDVAARLDQEAAEAKQALAKAEADYEAAGSDPALKLIGRTFDDPAALRQAQSAVDAAESTLRSADSALQNAQGAVDSVMKRAQDLEGQAQSTASQAASALKNATSHLAPHKPGWFSSMVHDFTSALSATGDWIKNHLNVIHSVLSTISGIAGLIALCTPPPIDVIAGAVALTAGGLALAVDAFNPKTRAAIGGLLSGHFTKANLEGAAGTGLDALNVIPGVGAISKGADALKITEDAGGAIKVADSIPSLADKIPGLSGLGQDAAAKFGDLADATGGASKYAKAASNYAHSPGTVVKLGVGAYTKLANIGKTGDEITSVAKSTVQNLQLAYKAKGVATSIYGDVKQAVS
jgi:hypothetical protein